MHSRGYFTFPPTLFLSTWKVRLLYHMSLRNILYRMSVLSDLLRVTQTSTTGDATDDVTTVCANITHLLTLLLKLSVEARNY